MFYVSANDEEDNSSDQNHAKIEDGVSGKSLTLKSNGSSIGGQFDTPPESPRPESREEQYASMESLSSKPPIPPPRTRKKAAVKNLEKLKLGEMTRQPATSQQADSESQISQVDSDILMAGYVQAPTPDDISEVVKGHLSMLVISAKGLRQMMKVKTSKC